MRRPAGFTLLALLLAYAGNALAARQASPEDIAYWQTYGPVWIFGIGIISVLLVLIIFVTLLWNRKRKDNRKR